MERRHLLGMRLPPGRCPDLCPCPGPDWAARWAGQSPPIKGRYICMVICRAAWLMSWIIVSYRVVFFNRNPP